MDWVRVRAEKPDDTARLLFSLCKHRSRRCIILCEDTKMIDYLFECFQEKEEVYVYKINVSGKSSQEVRIELKSLFRKLAPRALSLAPHIVLVDGWKRGNVLEAFKKAGCAFRMSIVKGEYYGNEKPLKVMLNRTELTEILNVFPLLPFSVIGYRSEQINLLQMEDDGKNSVAIASTYEYSMFYRSVVSSMLGYLYSYAGNEIIDTISDPNLKVISSIKETYLKNNIMYVIGYHPQYVWLNLLNGMRTRYIDVNPNMNMNDMILPSIKAELSSISANETDASHVKTYMIHNPRYKLADVDFFALAFSNNVVYIGAYPATHFDGLRLPSHKIIMYDPAFSEGRKRAIMSTGAKTLILNRAFDFANVEAEMKIIDEHFNNEKYIVLDDSFVHVDYDTFQLDKLKGFDYMISYNKPSRIQYICMKLNLYRDVAIHNVVALLPQPHGGSLREMRVFMNGMGTVYQHKHKDVTEYMSAYNKLPSFNQRRMIRHYHKMITICKDALQVEYPPASVICGLFSVSNDINSQNDVLKWIQKMHDRRNVLALNFINVDRIKFMQRVKFECGYNFSIKEKNDVPVVTTSTPSGSKWTDRRYALSDLNAVGLSNVSIEMLAAIMGDWYNGMGYTKNSTYVDLFDLYMSWAPLESHLLLQHIGTSPIANVKSFTSRYRLYEEIPHIKYYGLRGALVNTKLHELCPDSGDRFRLVNAPECTAVVLKHIQFPTEYGGVDLRIGDEINVSGHLLSLLLAAHYVPTSIDVWARQLIYCSKIRNVRANAKSSKDYNEYLYFDNKIDSSGRVSVWHSRNDLILTCLIAEDYVDELMGGIASEDIIDEYLVTMRKLLLEMPE